MAVVTHVAQVNEQAEVDWKNYGDLRLKFTGTSRNTIVELASVAGTSVTRERSVV